MSTPVSDKEQRLPGGTITSSRWEVLEPAPWEQVAFESPLSPPVLAVGSTWYPICSHQIELALAVFFSSSILSACWASIRFNLSGCYFVWSCSWRISAYYYFCSFFITGWLRLAGTSEDHGPTPLLSRRSSSLGLNNCFYKLNRVMLTHLWMNKWMG